MGDIGIEHGCDRNIPSEPTVPVFVLEVHGVARAAVEKPSGSSALRPNLSKRGGHGPD